ncbi:MAG: SET domain-containing protein-lysine N-methyltransferase [Alphaproteobacteria bacterium]|nr:SET domain-containing protein-lysine N-methyltransferase [Alphaproteobacteria bacterium]
MAMTWFSAKVKKRDSAIEGTGLWCITPIAAGEPVVIKGGRVFDRAIRDILAVELGPAEIQIEEDLFIGPMSAEERDQSMMYLNHSCDPNLGISGQIVFVAMRDIPAGEELTFDYAMGDDDQYEMVCNCRSDRCRGVITGQDWRKPEIRERYRGWFADYLQRRIEAEG